MKVVIQCSATKDKGAGTFTHDCRCVKFVAHPELYPAGDDLVPFRPDDLIPRRQESWRDQLVAYNASGANPDRLVKAGHLYSASAYGALQQHVGNVNMFILSAGWGLVRSDYLLPDYDITLKSGVEPWKRRHMGRDRFRDFNHLADADIGPDETLYFFGGKDYLGKL